MLYDSSMIKSSLPRSTLPVDELVALKNRIRLVADRIGDLMRTHEACRNAYNAVLEATDRAEGRTGLESLPPFALDQAFSMNQSAAAVALDALVALAEPLTVDRLAVEVRRKLPNATTASIRLALDRFAKLRAVLVTKDRGTCYRAADDAVQRAGGRRKRRPPAVTERISPRDVAEASEYSAAAAVELVLNGPMQGPQIHERLKNRLTPSGKLDRYVGSNLGHSRGFSNERPFGYWLAGVELPEAQQAILDAKGKGTRSGRKRSPVSPPAPTDDDRASPASSTTTARPERRH